MLSEIAHLKSDNARLRLALEIVDEWHEAGENAFELIKVITTVQWALLGGSEDNSELEVMTYTQEERFINAVRSACGASCKYPTCPCTENPGLVQRAVDAWDYNSEDVADGKVLRSFIKEHGATPSMVASQVEHWRKRSAAAEAVLEFIVAGYANQDVNHEDFRVRVYKAALETLTPYADEQLRDGAERFLDAMAAPVSSKEK